MIALDHYLPTGTGIEFLERLAQRADVPPVVYVTGSSELNLGVAAMRAGASDFVAKTVGDDFVTLLEAALAQAVARARLTGEKEAAETEVRRARDRAELLLAEVNHRVANSLALVSSLISLQADMLTDQAARNALAKTRARIFAIAAVHKHLYTTGDVTTVDLREYLTELLRNLGLSMQGHGAALAMDIVSLPLATNDMVNLGILVTELVTNAFKYAFPETPGAIRVRLRDIEGDRAELAVEDDGIGAGGPAKGTRLGTRIVTAMAGSLNADIAYADQHPGTVVRLTFPLRTG